MASVSATSSLSSEAPIGASPARAPGGIKASIGRELRRAAMLTIKAATDALPSVASRKAAILLGAVRAAISAQGPKNRRIIQQFTGVSERKAQRMARRYLTTMFLDFRFARRIVTGKERPETWSCEQRNFEIVRPLIEANRPYIVATGHFSREAQAYLFTKESVPHRLSTILARMKGRDSGAHYDQFLEGLPRIRPDLDLLYTGDMALKTLIRLLRSPGHAVVIAVDSFTPAHERGGFVRSFLKAQRRFATGTARLSRMAQCPIVVCVPQLEEDGAPVMLWKKVIEPAAPRDDESDIRITNEMLDIIEQAVIENPGQYALRFWR